AAVVQAVGARLRGLREEDSVLLEALVPTAHLPAPPPRSPAPRLPVALRICTLVCRSWGDRPHLCQVWPPPAPGSSPSGGWGTVGVAVGIPTHGWGTAMNVPPGYGAVACVPMPWWPCVPQQRGGARAHTDLLGVDFLLACVDDALELVALSTNSQRCLETCLLLEAMGCAVGEPPGDVPRLLAEALLHRAQCHLVEGKDILLIGAGGVSKSFVWEAARDYGLRVRRSGR
ncbi:CRNS1 synthase, partial [Ibidorhyncha struthersii]|nr:CRNS1 synthase [Ibidorhyncha struthersii]